MESAAPVMRGGAVRGGGIQVTSCVALNRVRRLYENCKKFFIYLISNYWVEEIIEVTRSSEYSYISIIITIKNCG